MALLLKIRRFSSATLLLLGVVRLVTRCVRADPLELPGFIRYSCLLSWTARLTLLSIYAMLPLQSNCIRLSCVVGITSPTLLTYKILRLTYTTEVTAIVDGRSLLERLLFGSLETSSA